MTIDERGRIRQAEDIVVAAICFRNSQSSGDNRQLCRMWTTVPQQQD